MPDKLDNLIGSLDLTVDQRKKLEGAIADRDSTLSTTQRSILADDEATDVGLCGFGVLGVDSVVPDLRVGHGYDLSPV